MKKIPKQECTAEFRELAVKRVKEGLTAGAQRGSAPQYSAQLLSPSRNWRMPFHGISSRLMHPVETLHPNREHEQVASCA